MSNQNMHVVCTCAVLYILCMYITEGKIFSRNLKEQSPVIITLKGTIPKDDKTLRYRRNADDSPPPMSGHQLGKENNSTSGKILDTTATVLADVNHNEAVVHWSGKNSSTIFVLTREHTSSGNVPDSALYRSTDYGTTYNKVNISSDAIVRYIYVSPANNKKLFCTDLINRRLYLTSDEGNNFDIVQIDFAPNKLLFHPVNDNVILGYDLKDGKLYLSMDVGKTWTLFKEQVSPRFFWGEAGLDNDGNTVHMEVQDSTGMTHYLACSVTSCTEATAEKSLGFIDPFSLEVKNEYIFVQKSDEYSSRLYVSYKRGPFRQAYFPLYLQALVTDFNILNADEGQVFVAVDHREDDVNLYLSDATGQFYTQTLPNVVVLSKPGWFDVDLYEVKGLSGTYIANQYDGPHSTKTYITFDKGGNWSLIPAPAEATECRVADGCSLHLHLGYSSTIYRIPAILSEVNAPGIVIAHGGMGTGLDLSVSTAFMSRNGGLTWMQLPFDGNYNLNILDQGGAITAILDSQMEPTNVVQFSCTEGKTWSQRKFWNQKIHVDGVLNEPGISTLVTSVFGHLNQTMGWVMVKLDFSSILTRNCQQSDYESWIPSDQVTDHKCILGQRLVYERRKQDSVCSNGRNYIRPINSSVCKCLLEDFECDYGYNVSPDGKCELSSWFNPDQPFWECPENQFYNKSHGYRKVASDKCASGIAMKQLFQTQKTKCPVVAPGKLTINSQKLVIGSEADVTFYLIQKEGSKISTKYVWDFGDGNNKTYTGIENASSVTHAFKKYGMYSVKVTARNKKGSALASIDVRVEDEIIDIHIAYAHSCQSHKPTSFNVTATSKRSDLSNVGHVHFVWTFGNEPAGQLPLLTWQRNLQHIYNKSGQYNLTVEAINSVSSVYRQLSIQVFDHLTVARLTFSANVDRYNSGTLLWRTMFATVLREKIAETLQVSRSRFIVSVHVSKPTVADLTIVPSNPHWKNQSSIGVISDNLKLAVHAQMIGFTLTGRGDIIQVTGISIADDIIPPSTGKNYKAVYIAVPILGVALVLIIISIILFKRRLSHTPRYAPIFNRSGVHSMLADDDTVDDDDDVPPLDPNPDFRGDNYDSSDQIIINTGLQPTLVMMTGPLSDRSDSNTADC